MKTIVKSDKSVTTNYRTVKLQIGDFIVTEKYTNNVLTDQIWSVAGGFKATHPNAYEPKHMHFYYYEDVSFLNSDKCCNLNGFYDMIPEPTMILDWDKFDSLDQVLCEYMGMDGNIYRITSPDPIPLWRYKNYIGGFDNIDYDLDEVVKIFSGKSWIRNIKIVDIPSYNRHDGRERAVEFEYKLPSRKALARELRKDPYFKERYISEY